MQRLPLLDGRRSRRSRLIGGALAACLVTAGIGVALASPAQARYATGGAGLYKGNIDWFEWGTDGSAIPAAGTTKTNTRTIGGATLATTCAIGTVSGGGLRVYRSGDFGGDSHDDLYNIGGANGANTLVDGLANTTDGQTINFSFSCSATLNGTPVALGGLVMADAEQSASNEFVQATIPAGATWRIIDRFRSSGCTSSTGASLDASGQTLKLAGPAADCGTGPSVTAFMDGATSADVVVKGGGRSAIALGVVLSADFGDAPASYGDDAALLSPTWSGGTLTPGTSAAVSDDSFALATLNSPTPRLGATVSGDSGEQASTNADADTGDDAITATGTGTVVKGSTYTLGGISCVGDGSAVHGWLDWNDNGTFDAEDASTASTCSGGTAAVGWTVPADAVSASPSFLRLAIGSDVASVATPSGVSLAGEIEDYAFTVMVPTDVPPTETIIGPADGATYFQGQTVPASYTCADTVGTVTSCTGDVPVGSPVSTLSTGTKSFSVTGTNDGNQSTTTTVHYKVVPVVGVCRGTPLSVGLLGLTLAPGTANPPTAPCVTDAKQVVNINVVITPAIPLLHVPGNSISVGALTGTSTNGPAGSASAYAQIPDITISLLGHTIEITALTSNASSTLTSCTSPATLVGHSTFATLAIDGVISPNQHTDKPLSIPVAGLGVIAFNQTSVSGNTVTQSAVHIAVAGLVDIALGQSVAGATCGS